jgi:hypothetical protein
VLISMNIVAVRSSVLHPYPSGVPYLVIRAVSFKHRCFCVFFEVLAAPAVIFRPDKREDRPLRSAGAWQYEWHRNRWSNSQLY